MRQVPYHPNPGNACALACFTMVAQYLLPDEEASFEQLGRVGDWREGYVVWEFPVWNWLLDNAIVITDYDSINYEAWIKDGTDGLRRSLPEDEFKWYQENTYDLDQVTRHVRQTFNQPGFTFIHRKPDWEDVLSEYQKPGICDIVLNARALNRQEGFVAHRVVLIEITDTEVVFHDPNKEATGAYRREPLAHFRTAFEAMESPALARYSLSI